MGQTTYGGTVLWKPSGLDRPSTLLELWGIGTARTLRAHWILAELGLPYISHRIQPRSGETMTPEYLKLNPRHKIPLLRHGTLLLTESAAIIQYLSEALEVPAGFFAPTDPAQRAKIHEWCYFVMNELDGHTLYLIRRHVGLKHIYGEAHTAVDAAKTYFREQIEALEPSFNAISHYLFGKDLSIADILLTTCLDWAVSVDIALPATVLSYRERVSRRPAYREARRRNDPSIPPPPQSGTTASAET